MIEKEGYGSQNVIISKDLSGWFLGNILSVGVLGMIIDALDGAMFRLSPSEINVILSEKEGMEKSETKPKAKRIGEREGDIAVLPLKGTGLPASNADLLWKAILEVCAVNTPYRVLTKKNVLVILEEKNIDINKCKTF